MERVLSEYEQELAERKVILQYFGLGQDELFDTDKILAAAARKLSDADLVRKGLEKEADALEKEYRSMSQGKVLELSEEFCGMLEEAGIHFGASVPALFPDSVKTGTRTAGRTAAAGVYLVSRSDYHTGGIGKEGRSADGRHTVFFQPEFLRMV